MWKLQIKPVNQLYNYSTVLGAAIKCKPYNEITVEIRTQLKTVKITSYIFAVQYLTSPKVPGNENWKRPETMETLQFTPLH